MVETNLALQLQIVDNKTDWQSIMIGNSIFTDDIWDLRPFIPAKTFADCHKYLNFSHIKNAAMKHTVKQYAYYKLGKVKPMTVLNYVSRALPAFLTFCSANGITSFAELTQQLFL